MTNSKQRIDEQGNIKLPKDFIAKLNWGTSTILNATLNPQSGALVLEQGLKGAAQTFLLDSLGRVALPRKQREKLGWMYIDTGDVISVTLHIWEGKISLQLCEKYELKCVFCGRSEAVAKITPINLSGICQHCIAEYIHV